MSCEAFLCRAHTGIDVTESMRHSFRPHRIHSIDVAFAGDGSGTVCVLGTCEACKNGSTDRRRPTVCVRVTMY